MTGVALAVASLIIAVSFGSNLHALTETPRMYGWDWDAALYPGNGYFNVDPALSASILDADPNIEARSGAYFGEDELNGIVVSLLGMEPDSEVHPPITEGRMISADNEIVLGRDTADELGVTLGDTVSQSTDVQHPLRVVGIATLPSIGKTHVRHVGLGPRRHRRRDTPTRTRPQHLR